MLEKSTTFVVFFIISKSSKNLTQRPFNVGDAMVYRAGILEQDICINFIEYLLIILNYLDSFLVVYAFIICTWCFSKTNFYLFSMS